MACDCDGEDTWIEVLDPADCTHECDEDDDPADWDDRWQFGPYSEFSERGT